MPFSAAFLAGAFILSASAQEAPGLKECGRAPFVRTCVCNGEVRDGERAASPCIHLASTDQNLGRLEAVREAARDPEGFWAGRFGGRGSAAGPVSVEVLDSKYVAVEGVGGGPTLPRGFAGPSVTVYRKYGDVKVSPFAGLDDESSLSFLKTRVRPFIEGTAGEARPPGFPARYVVGAVGSDGSVSTVQALPPLPPYDARRRLTGSIGGGVDVPLGREGRFDVVARVGASPFGGKEVSAGLRFHRLPEQARELFRRPKLSSPLP